MNTSRVVPLGKPKLGITFVSFKTFILELQTIPNQKTKINSYTKAAILNKYIDQLQAIST